MGDGTLNIFDIFTNLAFPVAVAVYLLVVVTKRLEELKSDHQRLFGYLALMLQQLGMTEAATNLIDGKEAHE